MTADKMVSLSIELLDILTADSMVMSPVVMKVSQMAAMMAEVTVAARVDYSVGLKVVRTVD
jgi:hypothetical protein